MDDIYDLIEQSSLGTPAAKAIRAMTPRWVVAEVLRRSRELEAAVSQDPERGEITYVTADSAQWLRISVPDGLVPPPTIDLHEPFSGPVTFYHARSFGLPVPPGAQG